MADICHCPGKDGVTVMGVLDKQLMRPGMSRYEVFNVVGDGGGENEGSSGIHATMETEVPGYVRRRCLGHVAWRVADAMLDEWDQYSDVKTLCSYMSDGVTWSRLQALATTPVLEGGLGLFQEMSREHKAIFGRAPGGIVEGRPESVLHFLTFLRGKEHVLHLVCARDLEQRRLAKNTRQAVALLGDVQGRAERSICGEVLHRALYLHRWVNEHNSIAGAYSLEGLLSRAEAVVQDLSLDDLAMDRLGTSQEAIDARPWRPSTWVEEATWLVYQDRGLTTLVLPTLLGFHRRLVSRTQSHLSLTVHNFLRTSWMAATLLNRDPGVAQEGANKLLEHLLQTAPARRTPFEMALAENDAYMGNLQAFANVAPPCRLWQGQGAYKPLFRFLALRFLLAPDQVLDCERAHARWQWFCALKRNLTLPSMNALLRCTRFLEQHGGEFPPPEDLRPWLEAEQAHIRRARAAIDAADEIAPGWRNRAVYLERFNLRAADLDLLGEEDAPLELVSYRTSYQTSFSVYLRSTFQPQRFHHAPGVSANLWVYVLDTKTIAGREPRDALDAQSRPMVVSFFERDPSADAMSLVVRRVDREADGMVTSIVTAAELLVHLGYPAPLDPNMSAAEKELVLENAFLELQTLVYDSRVVADQSQIHVYKLENARDCEDAFMESMPLAEHTKFSLARCLERRHGWDKRTLQAQSKAALLAHFPGEAPDAGRGRGRGRGAALGAAPGAAPGAALAAGRGRGRGAAPGAAPVKGRGRGRGAAPGAAPVKGRGRGRGAARGRG